MRRRLILGGLLAAITLGLTGCPAIPWEPPEPYTTPEEACLTTATGPYVITEDGATVNGLCLTDGYVEIRADNVTVTESQIFGASEGGYWNPIVVVNGAHGTVLEHNLIDCGLANEGTPVASQGIRSPWGDTSGRAAHNEIRDCSDGIQAASNWRYEWNYIHRPDNTDETHADGVQWDTEDDGSPIHDVTFVGNTVLFPVASSSFQYHNNTDPAQGSYNIVVHYNTFRGGAAVVRIPRYGGPGNVFTANKVMRLDTEREFFACTTTENGTAPIQVWGDETGRPEDANILEATGEVLTRELCEAGVG